ncbi:NADH:flavin oxidoreductase [Candidatus Bathyarchaeota archaeon]|nr:NADH:flavin oxidoreductase [Candidatus Bathyarchaeota archaeon]
MKLEGLTMSKLFEPFKIGSMEIRNRFMRSATTSYWSDENGIVRPEIIRLYEGLSKGGVGLIVKGHTYVMDSGKAHVGMAGISGDHQVPKLRELTDVVHEHGGKIVTQLNHAGYKSIVDRAGPSEYQEGDWKGRALTVDEIHGIVDAFGEAAERTMDAEFDGVMIHGAHGYLVSQFLSRLANRRTDEYGGSLENRMRLLTEVYDEIRGRVGASFPVLIKMNCDDFSPNGFTVEDSIKVASAMAKRGMDLIEISGGGMGQVGELRRTRAKSDDPALSEANFAGHAEKIHEAINPTPMGLVNGIRTRRCMEALLEKGVTEMISMSRPFIREPDLVRNLEAGQLEATCISCDACSGRGVFSKMMLMCHQE